MMLKKRLRPVDPVLSNGMMKGIARRSDKISGQICHGVDAQSGDLDINARLDLIRDRTA